MKLSAELREKHPFLPNLPALEVKGLNNEVVKVFPAQAFARDRLLESIQSQLGHEMAALRAVIGSLMKTPGTRNPETQPFPSWGKQVGSYNMSMSRR